MLFLSTVVHEIGKVADPQFRKKHNRGPNPFLNNCECWYHIRVTNVNTKADASHHISRWLLPGGAAGWGLLNCATAWKNFRRLLEAHVRRTWQTHEPQREVHGRYREKDARVIPFKSERGNGGGGGSRRALRVLSRAQPRGTPDQYGFLLVAPSFDLILSFSRGGECRMLFRPNQ